MVMGVLLCQMFIIIKDKLSLVEQMVLVLIKQKIHYIKEILKIMFDMEKVNKKRKDIIFQDNFNTDKKNQVFINLIPIFMKEIFLTGFSMARENLQPAKDNMLEILRKANNMVMDNLNGIMVVYIEEIIIKAKEKASENILIVKIQAYLKGYGEKVSSTVKANIYNLEDNLINVFGLMEKSLHYWINDDLSFLFFIRNLHNFKLIISLCRRFNDELAKRSCVYEL